VIAFRTLEGNWAARHGGVRVSERRATPPLGHFSLIRFGRVAAGEARDPLSRRRRPNNKERDAVSFVV
jgi:hypothetical protein